MIPEDQFQEWRRDQWIRFLDGERAGGRRTLSAWLSLGVTILAVLVGVLISLARGDDLAFAPVIVAILIWALVIVAVAGSVWYYHLGTVRSLSRAYFAPDSGPFRSGRILLDIDMGEVALKDAGNLFNLMFYETTQLRGIRDEAGVRALVLGTRIAFWITIALTVSWLVGLFLMVLKADALSLLLVLIFGATGSAIATGLAIRAFSRRVAILSESRRHGGQTPPN
ncbi:MAG TPA: hypothetical protein VF944_00560 [Candidatus Bathyarchaeia archaeon]